MQISSVLALLYRDVDAMDTYIEAIGVDHARCAEYLRRIDEAERRWGAADEGLKRSIKSKIKVCGQQAEFPGRRALLSVALRAVAAAARQTDDVCGGQR